MKSGIINVYKEEGFTSFDVIAKLRGILHFKKLGHTGTLDPMATGVLPVCIGKATKVCDLLTNKDKTYRATMLLGVTTDTLDVTGTELSRCPINVTPADVEKTLNSFLGESMQIPPMYSALKVDGKRLYELARAGVEVERKPRPITVYELVIEEINLPEVTFTITCSKGTYIRSIIADAGQMLGCGATMKALERTKVSVFDVNDSLTLSQIENLMAEGQIDLAILPIDEVFDDYISLTATAEVTKRLENGGDIFLSELAQPHSAEGNKDIELNCGKTVRLYTADGRFVGLYSLEADRLHLVKMFLE